MTNQHITKQTISRQDLEDMTPEELAEKFKEADLEVCLEPLSEWGSDLESLFQKLEKGVMQWYEAGLKRSFTICFLDEASVEEPLEHPHEKPVSPRDSQATLAVS
jgi:hypothetical protein